MFTGELLPFQEEAFDAMLERRKLLVAYDMGLGKTVITIATLEELFDEGEITSGLIITPASLKYQWLDMIEDFTDGAIAQVVDGTKAQRIEMYDRASAGEWD